MRSSSSSRGSSAVVVLRPTALPVDLHRHRRTVATRGVPHAGMFGRDRIWCVAGNGDIVVGPRHLPGAGAPGTDLVLRRHALERRRGAGVAVGCIRPLVAIGPGDAALRARIRRQRRTAVAGLATAVVAVGLSLIVATGNPVSASVVADGPAPAGPSTPEPLPTIEYVYPPPEPSQFVVPEIPTVEVPIEPVYVDPGTVDPGTVDPVVIDPTTGEPVVVPEETPPSGGGEGTQDPPTGAGPTTPDAPGNGTDPPVTTDPPVIAPFVPSAVTLPGAPSGPLVVELTTLPDALPGPLAADVVGVWRRTTGPIVLALGADHPAAVVLTDTSAATGATSSAPPTASTVAAAGRGLILFGLDGRESRLYSVDPAVAGMTGKSGGEVEAFLAAADAPPLVILIPASTGGTYTLLTATQIPVVPARN